jgi:hypothetical protein
MKILPLAIAINLVMSALIVGYAKWLENKKIAYDLSKREYAQGINKLGKISNITLWLDDAVVPNFISSGYSLQEADKNLISFFDLYKQKYNLSMNKYIFQGKDTRNMEFLFEIPADEKSKIRDFLMLKNDKGFLQFKSLKIDNEKISGTIEVAQSYKKVLDASK